MSLYKWSARGIKFAASHNSCSSVLEFLKAISLRNFGIEKGTLKSCDTVQLAVKSADNLTVYVNACVVPLICSPLWNQAIDFARDR